MRITRAGREFKACCPFHKEKTPSFTINDAKGFYYCFGCGAKGDVLNFVMKHDNLDFRPAVELLAAEAGMAVPQDAPRDIVREKKQKNLYDLMEDAAQWFTVQLHDPRHGDVLEYVRRVSWIAKRWRSSALVSRRIITMP
ncbi:MAG: CHC2 zinc finger domain-containing protein [Alphaproteobacteria bacterium]|nr:CHC2 zinc finger domain-containing protein [Alphaproteobacteria bacterium]